MGRRIGKSVVDNAVAPVSSFHVSYAYDQWNPVAEGQRTSLTSGLTPTDLKRTHLWGTDIGSDGTGYGNSTNFQAAGGVGGLISSSYHGNDNGTPVKDHFIPSYDANGNIIAWSDGGGTLLQRRDYDPFGKPVMIESFGSASLVTKITDHGFSTKPQDAETGLYYYGYRYYDPVTGRWPSRDPIGENGGVNLYEFVGNAGVNKWDYLGMWKEPDRDSNDATSEVCAEENDTWQGLADLVGLNYSEVPNWVTNWHSLTDADGPTSGKMYRVPNTIVAHWTGDVGGLGKFYVRWDENVAYIKELGFKVIESESKIGGDFALQNSLEFGSRAKALHGMYYWGHGGWGTGNENGAQYPAIGLGSNTHGGVIDLLVAPLWRTNEASTAYQASAISLKYKMAAVFAFACDTKSLKSHLVSSNENSICHGYTGTLYPIFKTYGL